MTNPPAFGTFYWLSGVPPAPYPFDPSRGLLPIWSFNGAYYADDSELLLSLEGGGLMSSMGLPFPGPKSGGGGDTNCYSLTNFTVDYFFTAHTQAVLGIAPTTNPWVALTIQTTNTVLSYDVFGTTNLAKLALPSLSQTNWTWLTRAHGSATNFPWGEFTWCQRYFQLGTMTDYDNDGLTDAYETLTSHTATNAANSPQAIYEAVIASQNPSNWFKLNDSTLTNTISGQAALTSTAIWDVDAFATGNNAVEFNGTSQRSITGSGVINGGTGTSQGSLSFLFRSLTGYPTTLLSTQRYVFSQRGNGTNELGLFFETNTAPVDPGSLKMRIGSETNTILASNAIVFGTWYYLTLTWNESSNRTTWYLAPIGGMLNSSSINFGATNAVGNSSNVVFGNRQGVPGNNNSSNFPNAFRTPGNGALDQIALWNRQLSASEVNEQFNALSALFQGPAKAFDLSRWNLLLPVDKTNQLNTNHKALEISTRWLNSGFKYVNPTNWTQKYFYLSNGNQIVFEAPWNGARSSTNASPRSELRETTLDGNEHNWLPLGTNTLEATCAVHSAGTNNDRKVIIGQIQTETASDPPVAISYNFPSSKNLTATYKSSPGSSTDNNLLLATNVNVFDQIHYQMQLTDDGTSVILYVKTFVNEVLQSTQQRTMVPYASWHTNTFYFKAGCYFPTGNSGSPMAGTAKVVFSSLTATHQP